MTTFLNSARRRFSRTFFLMRHPLLSFRQARLVPTVLRGAQFGRTLQAGSAAAGPPSDDEASPTNPLRAYFESHKTGRGIFKWDHYFDIYHRHLHKFVGRDVHIAEVGVYSGGSLDMWLEYFGPRATVHGIDIEASCKEYEDHRVKIAIGDQADRQFWARFKQENPIVDVLIDDGGHTTEQQITTLEEIIPHLRPAAFTFARMRAASETHFTHTCRVCPRSFMRVH